MIKKQTPTLPSPTLKLTITKAKTFQCVDCGNRFVVASVSKKIDTNKPKYCKYCVC